MGINKQISELLREYGFKNVLGTNENHASGTSPVKRGTPFSWDYNNAVTVIYDEKGEPWVKSGVSMPPTSQMNAQLKRGAHVPHSNDGGYFINEVLPTL